MDRFVIETHINAVSLTCTASIVLPAYHTACRGTHVFEPFGIMIIVVVAFIAAYRLLLRSFLKSISSLTLYR